MPKLIMVNLRQTHPLSMSGISRAHEVRLHMKASSFPAGKAEATIPSMESMHQQGTCTDDCMQDIMTLTMTVLQGHHLRSTGRMDKVVMTPSGNMRLTLET